MKHVFSFFILFAMSIMAWGQEEREELERPRRALTSTGTVVSVGEYAKTCGMMTAGFSANIGKRFVPNFQMGVGVMPGLSLDWDWGFSDSRYEDYENDADVFVVMPTYAWAKYDFIKKVVSPYVSAQIGTQVSSYSRANGVFYRGVDVGCRIALRRVAICPHFGYASESADYEHIAHARSVLFGINAEF